jgi:lipopolysaccharide export system protein LptA
MMSARWILVTVALVLPAGGIGKAQVAPASYKQPAQPSKPAAAASKKGAAAPAASPSAAAADGAPGDDQPRDQGTLEVTADHDLEWLQQDHAYVARGNAVAKRGTVTLTGDTLIAFYRPLATPPGGHSAPAAAVKPGATPRAGFDSGSTEIWRVVAEGNVHIVSVDRDAWGDRAEYDKDKSVVVLTGRNLKATTLTDTVTARDSLEYWDSLEMAVARGNARVVKVDGDTLDADVIAGHFVKNAQNQTELKTIEGKGHVVLTTQTDIVHGDEGTYDLVARRTVMFGNVHATRGESELDGASAEVNMDTGISQVYPAPGERVKGLFVRQPSLTPPPPPSDKKKSSPH